MLRVAWSLLRISFGHWRGGYLTVVLLVGLIGHVAMGAVAAVRRTQASFAAYLANTSPSHLTVLTGAYGAGPGSSAGYDPALVAKISRLPPREVGRELCRARCRRALAPSGAVRFNMGSVLQVGFYINAQEQMPGFGKAGTRPYLRLKVGVVGKAVFSRELVQDDVDSGLDGGLLFTPALTRQLTKCCVSFTETAVRLDDGGRDVAAAEARIERVLPRGFPGVRSAARLSGPVLDCAWGLGQ